MAVGTPTPTGRIMRTPVGRDLVLKRHLRPSVEEVWAALTDPDRAVRWFASWTGGAEVGSTVRCTMTHEEGQPEIDLVIDACDAPQHLAVHSVGPGGWRLAVRLANHDGTTELTFVQHLDAEADVGAIGPGWEYYLDLLAWSIEERPLEPAFDDYFPAQQRYYLDRSV